MTDLSENTSRQAASQGVDAVAKQTRGESAGSRLKVLDLFSGVGAYSLGLERTGGFKTVAFCEIEEFPRRILRKHWPDVPIYHDVRELTAARLRAAGIVPDWIVAGWPCQDISVAGSGHGLDGERSGLWDEIRRLAGELRPQGLLLENSSNLLAINDGADFGTVLGDLAALGYDAEWHCLPAAAFDAPHIRDRLWIVATLADPAWDVCGERAASGPERKRTGQGGQPYLMADANGQRPEYTERALGNASAPERHLPSRRSSAVADADRQGLPLRTESSVRSGGSRGTYARSAAERSGAVPNANVFAQIGTAIARSERAEWQPEPGLGRVVARSPNRVDRLRALGNLNPPIVPEIIGRAFLETRRAMSGEVTAFNAGKQAFLDGHKLYGAANLEGTRKLRRLWREGWLRERDKQREAERAA